MAISTGGDEEDPPAMIPASVTGVAAAAGGVCWIAKTALIWANGGRGATTGAAGQLFLTGAAFLAIAAASWAWHATVGRALPLRILAMGGALVGLVLAVILPILVGYALIPGSWLAEEIGVIAIASLAVLVGIRSRIRSPG